jgi:hypothetical protein
MVVLECGNGFHTGAIPHSDYEQGGIRMRNRTRKKLCGVFTSKKQCAILHCTIHFEKKNPVTNISIVLIVVFTRER